MIAVYGSLYGIWLNPTWRFRVMKGNMILRGFTRLQGFVRATYCTQWKNSCWIHILMCCRAGRPEGELIKAWWHSRAWLRNHIPSPAQVAEVISRALCSQVIPSSFGRGCGQFLFSLFLQLLPSMAQSCCESLWHETLRPETLRTAM